MKGAVLALGLAAAADNVLAVDLLTDINTISRYWGQIASYVDNADNYFGVDYVGVPDGCKLEQAHLLQRHAQRGPTSYFDDGINDERFVEKLTNFTSANNNNSFTGPLAFLNDYEYFLPDGLLTGFGAITEFTAGVTFWNRYGRILFDAVPGQIAYNASFTNGTARPKPLLRTTSQARMENTEINWALGFFGPSFLATPDPTLANATSAYNLLIIPEGGSENNTLASYDSCFGDYDATTGYLGDLILENYIPTYLGPAAARLQQFAPAGFNFTANDTYAMQSLCAYESGYIGSSEFCPFFTADEWAGFENTLDIEYYYDYGYGNPTGRSQGLGYLQEVLARLQNQYITSSNSSVNSTLDNNPETFPLGQKMYADFSHDDIIVSVLTAMSMDYFKDPPSISQFPPNPNRHFNLANLTPFGSRLVTEVWTCDSPSPSAVQKSKTFYPSSSSSSSATNSTKFVRMRLNNGILPLNSIRGGACGNTTTGRVDGLCALNDFVASQSNASALANYGFACFGNYTLTDALEGKDYDGTIYE